jgi:RNA polymerase-binding transcription factor
MKSNAFLKQTQQHLIARRDALRRSLTGDMSSLRAQHEGAVGDEIDAAIATEQAELNSQMASFESRELAQISLALEKLREGRYGRCESCEKAISPVRLKALPYATDCIDCARHGERRPAGSGHHSPVNRIAAFTGDDSEVEDEAYEEIG